MEAALGASGERSSLAVAIEKPCSQPDLWGLTGSCVFLGHRTRMAFMLATLAEAR